MIRAVSLAGALVVLALPALAQTTVPLSVGVMGHALDMSDNGFTAEQEDALASIAYQSAVSRTCPEFDIDTAKLTAAVNGLTHSDAGDLSPEETLQHDRMVMMVLGVATGGVLAAFMDEPMAFCDGAVAFREAGDTLFADE